MKYLLIVVLFVGLIGGFFFLSTKNRQETPPIQSPQQQDKEVNFKARFLIFTNGTKRDFSSSKYHNLASHVYLESADPTAVVVRQEGVTWGDFFATLPMKLTKECLTTGTGQQFCTGSTGTLKFYINGIKEDNFLEKEINEGDRALITFGSETEKEIQKQLSSF